ncbi:hypothetical protein ACFPTO_15325 [Paraburkholderia denitrificans]|uniref:Uncharacterized protein n=1 Tax=Paraburkholderia denitrificans TaxID=694025 RepID=A0ABW0JB36_9BURK
MQIISAQQIQSALDWPGVLDALSSRPDAWRRWLSTADFHDVKA